MELIRYQRDKNSGELCATPPNEKCPIEFRTKKSLAHMSSSNQSGDRGFQRSVCLKSYNVQKWEIRFTLGFNTAKNTHYIKTTFIWSFFWFDAYFWQRWAVNWVYFSVSVQNNISTISMFWAPSSTPWEIDMCARGLFCTKFNSKQLLFEAFFLYHAYFWQRWAIKWT